MPHPENSMHSTSPSPGSPMSSEMFTEPWLELREGETDLSVTFRVRAHSIFF